jgi:hypothetical protein
MARGTKERCGSESCSRLPGFICLDGVGPRGHLHLDAKDITGVAEDRDGRVTLLLRTSGTLVYVNDSQAEVEAKVLAAAAVRRGALLEQWDEEERLMAEETRDDA